MLRSGIVCATLLLGLFTVACQRSASPTAPTTAAASAATPAPAFQISGDPAAGQGATWTLRSTDGGVSYDLRGILWRPAGPGPFPAVIVSHGLGGSAEGYGRAIAAEMVTWGLVVVATNYTHAGGGPVGSPGTAAEPGASDANVLRATKLLDLLASLGTVDMSRVAAHGHSAGAFVTAAFAGAQSPRLRAASQTAGGVAITSFATATMATTEAQARTIAIPLQLHHGDRDPVVPLALGQRLAAILGANGVPHDLVVYAGEGHDIGTSPVVLGRVRDWYVRHGVLR
jgi:dienelactone hydrolase